MYIECLAPHVTPEAIAHSLHGRELAWLDSNAPECRDGRYSFVTAAPDFAIEVPLGVERPWSAFDRMRPSRAVLGRVGDLDLARIPYWIGFVAYDAAQSARRSASPIPALRFARHRAGYLFDHHQKIGWLIADDREAAERIEEIRGRRTRGDASRVSEIRATRRAKHADAIRIALDHIRAGDIYQVNLARRWRGKFSGSPLDHYRQMRERDAVPLGAYLETPDFAILSRSMERFLRSEGPGGHVETRPIKGTTRRRSNRALEASELHESAKENAEHSMIVDLMRNDLGRIAVIGSVRVDEMMTVEQYSTLSHLVSTISATLRPEVGVAALLDATFPPGSVTGTPKIRAMEIIDALEPMDRGIYTGAIGAIDREGGVSLSVAIRTAVISGEEICYCAGGGIVEASDIAHEIAETELKARPFLDALGEKTGTGKNSSPSPFFQFVL